MAARPTKFEPSTISGLTCSLEELNRGANYVHVAYTCNVHTSSACYAASRCPCPGCRHAAMLNDRSAISTIVFPPFRCVDRSFLGLLRPATLTPASKNAWAHIRTDRHTQNTIRPNFHGDPPKEFFEHITFIAKTVPSTVLHPFTSSVIPVWLTSSTRYVADIGPALGAGGGR